MDSLNTQISKLSYAIIRKMVEEPDVVTGHVPSSTLERLIPKELRPIYNQAKYLAPSSVEVLKKRLNTMIELVGEYELVDGLDKVECPDDNETVTFIQELTVLNGKREMQETLAKSIADLESGEAMREQEAVDRLALIADQYKRVGKADESLNTNNHVDIQNDDTEEVQRKISTADRSKFPRTGTIMDTWMVLGPGELGVILAGPAVGKTTEMVDLGAGYMENDTNQDGLVIHFSEEMSMPTVLDKYMNRMGITRLEELRKKGGLVIESHPSGTSTVPFLKSRIINLLNGRRLIAVVVDYIGIMQGSKQSRYESLSEIVVDLRGMAGYFGCPVWTGSQPQRAPFKDFNSTPTALKNFKPPVLGMADVAECWAIPHVSDYIISLNQTEEEKEKDIPEVRVHGAKVRIPHKGLKAERTIKAQIDYGRCRIL